MTKNTFLLLSAIVVLSGLWLKIMCNLLRGKGAKPFYVAPWDLGFNQQGKPILKPKQLFVNELIAKIHSVIWLIGISIFILVLLVFLFESIRPTALSVLLILALTLFSGLVAYIAVSKDWLNPSRLAEKGRRLYWLLIIGLAFFFLFLFIIK